MVRSSCTVLALVALGARAQDRWDHRGAVSLLVASGLEYRAAVQPGVVSDNGARANLDLGGTASFGEHWSAIAQSRLTLGGPLLGLSFFAGVRNHWGERFKTFFDLTVAVHALPTVTIGPRFAVGGQYELSQVIGIYALVATQFGGAVGVRFVADLSIGLQFRSYLLE